MSAMDGDGEQVIQLGGRGMEMREEQEVLFMFELERLVMILLW